MKTKEELNELREEVEALNKKLHELTEEELEQVTGGNKAHVVGGVDLAHLGVGSGGVGGVEGGFGGKIVVAVDDKFVVDDGVVAVVHKR